MSDEKAEENYDLKSDVDVKIEADSESLILLLFGRSNTKEIEQENKLKILGDRQMAFKLLDILSTKYLFI